MLEDPSADPWGISEIEPVAQPKVAAIRLGNYLPNIARSVKCPGDLAITKVMRRLWARDEDIDHGADQKKLPKLYVLVFPGAADAVVSGWARMEYDAPDYVEFATYEWPAHGGRSEEPGMNKMRDIGPDAFETFREAMSTGSFCILAHSIGCQIATYCCYRAERELGVKPQAAFMMDRCPPHMKVWTEYGMDKMKNSPEHFVETYQPSFAKAVREKLYEGAETAAAMWVNDEQLNNDVLPLGFYKWPCRVFVFIATEAKQLEVYFDEILKSLDAEARFKMEEHSRFRCSGRPLMQLMEWFQEWEECCDNVSYVKLKADHISIKNHFSLLGVVYRVVKDILKRAELREARDAMALRGGS